MLFSPNLAFLFFLLHFVLLFISRLVRKKRNLLSSIFMQVTSFLVYLEKRNRWTQVRSKLCDVSSVIIMFLLRFALFSPTLRQFLKQRLLSATQYRDLEVEYRKNKPDEGFFRFFLKMLKMLSTNCALNKQRINF